MSERLIYLETCLSRFDRCNVTSNAPSDYDEIMFLCRHQRHDRKPFISSELTSLCCVASTYPTQQIKSWGCDGGGGTVVQWSYGVS